jgi:hypothetical protein
MLRRLDSLSLLGGGERLKSCMARIVPNHSAFWKHNTFLGSFLILPMKRGGGVNLIARDNHQIKTVCAEHYNTLL